MNTLSDLVLRPVGRVGAVALVLAFLTTGFGAPVPGTHGLAAPRAYHVATNGKDSDPGTAAKPFLTIGKAVGVVVPGDSILVHAGIYGEIVRIRRSGTDSRRILLTKAGDGPVTLQPTLDPVPCDATNPTRDRAIQFLDGVDSWIVRGLTIVGGIVVQGSNINEIDNEDPGIFTDRTLPGRGDYDPVAGATLLESLGVDGADEIQIVDNTIRGRGILTLGARRGLVSGNDVGFIDCGTGSGVWINRFSDGWLVTGNFVHHTNISFKHAMEEGIRFGSASMYNTAEANTVEDLPNRGRGITADVNAGWNVIRNNVVRRAMQGYNDQTGNWGNQWVGNVAESNRVYGYNIDAKDDFMLYPDDSVPAFVDMSCNVSIDNPVDLNIGSVRKATFSGNDFRVIVLSENVRSHWGPAGNLWEGSTKAPPPLVTPAPTCS